MFFDGDPAPTDNQKKYYFGTENDTFEAVDFSHELSNMAQFQYLQTTMQGLAIAYMPASERSSEFCNSGDSKDYMIIFPQRPAQYQMLMDKGDAPGRQYSSVSNMLADTIKHGIENWKCLKWGTNSNAMEVGDCKIDSDTAKPLWQQCFSLGAKDATDGDSSNPFPGL